MCRKGLVNYCIMVSSISSTNVLKQATTAVQQDDIKTLLKYVNNEALQEVPDTFSSTLKSGVGSAAVFEGIPVLNFLRKGKKVKELRTSEGTKVVIKDAMKAMDERTSKAFKNIFKGTDGTLGERIAKFVRTQNQTKKDFISLKDATKSANKASKLYTKGNPDKVNQMMSAIDDAIEKADYFVNPMKTDIRSAKLSLNDAVEALAKNPNSKKLKKTVEKATQKLDKLNTVFSGGQQVGKFAKFKNFMKSSGAGMMLIFSGISEATTEVIPTFQELGTQKGLKQLGKSTVKVITDTAAFVAGEQAGMALGSAIGTAIMPGIGTAVGAVCGFIGGMLGSFVAGKATKALLGKSEREIAKEQMQQEQAALLQTDTASLEELKQSAKAKIEAEKANGTFNEDSQIALQTLENIEKANPFTV